MAIIIENHMKKPLFQGLKFQRKILSRAMGGCHGFTIIEIMIVLALIGILAAIAIPNYIQYRKKAQVAKMASDLVNFEKAYMIYAIEEGGFPNDTHLILPDQAKMGAHIDPEDWDKPTPLGGRFNWEGPDFYPYAGIAIDSGTAPVKDFVLLDELMDDGNLSQGKFRQTPNGRYTYIIAE